MGSWPVRAGGAKAFETLCREEDGELLGVEGGVGKKVGGAAPVSRNPSHPAFQAPDVRSHPWSPLSCGREAVTAVHSKEE